MLESNTQLFVLFGGRSSPILWRTWTPTSAAAPHIALAAAIAWVPLVVLGFLQGIAVGPTARESVLADPALYARFLIALPLLLYAPSRIDPMLHAILRNFLDKGLIGEADKTNFIKAIGAAQNAKDSRVADIVCLILAYASLLTILFVYRGVLAPEVGMTWYSYAVGEERRFTLAGWWYLAVSQPLYFLVLFRFLYRLAIWWRLLFRISELPLRLNSLDPDQSAGVGFVRLYLRPFRLPALAIAASTAGSLADVTLWTDVTIAHYQFAVGFFVVLVVAAIAGPLAFFTIQIRRAREDDLLAHGVLAARQLEQFQAKWRASGGASLEMLGVADFSALTDFNTAIAGAARAKGLFAPFDLGMLAFSALAPFLFVVLLDFPLQKILSQLVKLVGFVP